MHFPDVEVCCDWYTVCMLVTTHFSRYIQGGLRDYKPKEHLCESLIECWNIHNNVVSVLVKTKRNKEEEHGSKKRKLEKRKKADPKKKDKKEAESKSNPPVQLLKGWSELIPVELLTIIFQHAMKQIIGSKIPFLCR